MNVHRLVALVSATALVGLMGVAAQASVFAAPHPKSAKVFVKTSLREKVKNAEIDGCGG